MRKIFGFGLALFLIVVACFVGKSDPVAAKDATAAPAAVARRVKVLFLGDNGHHVPLERCRNIAAVLAQRDIDLVYTDDLNDLNPQNLNRYDVLMLYANWPTISPAQEKALLDYVEDGHGFAPIHCASGCFANSPKITALIGARFKSHNTGVFEETIAQPDHPIERGLHPIKSWDESYVQNMFNPVGREVLSYRVEKDHREPYTWTRVQGKGRVFYTAWGHDERTWLNPDFQNLLERGLRWAAGDWALAPRPANHDFTYTPQNIPFYPSGGAQGVTAKPLTEMQNAVSPEISMRHMVVRPGFEVKLFASEPQVVKPICLAFDERGRLWVAETVDYPNDKQPLFKGHDRITICEDTNGDGTADKFTVFADHLSIPSSIVFANGGIIVSQAPEMLFLKDTKGTGHADLRKVLFTGWGTRDTHSGPSNLHWGFDNWIYGSVGYSGFDGVVGGERLRFGAGAYRFKPDGSKLEFLGSTTNNTWGLGISEDNHVTGSTANSNPNWSVHIANRYYELLKGWPASRFEKISDTPNFYPITPRVRQVDSHGSYTAGAGHELYTARSFPKRYWNRIAFVGGPTGHLLGQFILKPEGSDFVAINDFSLLASDDEWTAPIAARVGPDGAVWMIDWYNYIVQHNPSPHGFHAGKGNAFVTSMRDKTHGRVYRIIWKDGTPSKTFDLSHADAATMFEALKSPNMFWRMQAQRLLVERGDKSMIPGLIKLAEDKSVDEIGLNPTVIHALWTIDGLHGYDDSAAIGAAVADLKHPSAGVREAAVDVLPRNAASIAAILKAKLLQDSDAQVRKSALLALSEMPSSDQAGAAIYAAMQDAQNIDDPWISDAIAISGSMHGAGFLRAAFAGHGQPGGVRSASARSRVIGIVVQQYAYRGPVDSVVDILDSARRASPELAEDVVNGLAKGWPKGVSPKLDASEVARLKSIMDAVPPSARNGLIALAARWGHPEVFAAQEQAIVASLNKSVTDTSLSAAQRIDAAHWLILIDDSPAVTDLILKQIAPSQPPAVQAGLLDALALSQNSMLGATLVDQYIHFDPDTHKKALSILVNKTSWIPALLDGVESGKINNHELLQQQWTVLKMNSSPEIAARADKLQRKTGNAPSADRVAVINKFLPVIQMTGDPAKGKLVFQQNCMVCHTIDGQGGKVGPILTGIGVHPKVELLNRILDPNRSIEGTYRQWIVKTKSGDVVAGRIYAENKESIEIMDAAAQLHEIQRSDIARLASTNKTLMPEGFEQLGEQKLADLLEFLGTSRVKP